MKKLWVTVALAGVCAGAWSAEEIKLRGAAEVIRAVTAEQEAMREKNTGNKDSIENFLATVKAYMQGMDAQTPDAAAEGWLKLADQLLETGVAEDEDEDRWSFRCYREKETAFMSLVGALPPPDAWAQIREGLAKRQDVEYASRRSLLQVLMAYLAQDTEAAQNHLAVLTEKEKGDKPDVSELESFLKDGKQNVDDRRLKRLNDTLARTVSIYGSIAIPDLVSLTSPKEAEALLRKVFARRIPFDTVAGEETLALAQRIALEMRDDWVMPHWSLVTGSPEGETLYDLFVKRFLPFEQEPKPDEVESTFYEPTHYHQMTPICGALARLITPKLKTGKIDEAAGLVLPYVSYALKAYPKNREDVTDFSRRCEGAVPAKAQYDFYCQLLAKVPDFPINKGFIMSGIASGQVPAVEQLLTERLNTPGLSPEQRSAIQEASVTLLLATDRIAEAIALRTEILADGLKSRKDDSNEWVRYALDTAALAALVNDAQVQNASLDIAIKRWKKGLESGESFWGGSTEKLILALEQYSRASEVEPLLVELLVQKHDALTHLVNFYARHNRMADVVALLEDAPWWDEAHDVLQLIDYDPVVKPIANAFHETGRTAEAEQLLTAVMRESHSEDWAYELLLKMAGDKLDGFLVQMDALYARDAFEERPLIWKAEALRRLKRLEEAEQVIRHALKVDPTDGEQPAGERVRAYAVLGDILADRGKAEDAKFFRDVVEAVRLAEEGDKQEDLGLVQRSLNTFAKATELFADAYCVQWRLAERMREMGKLEEAQKHYEIAFERMPEQFGQVASLCFGCMGIFSSPESVCAAEAVLTRLADTPPVRPAVYYLMGQLRETQKRYEEAYDWYTKALEKDPGYLDVMKNLYGMKETVKRPGVDWAALQTSIFRLDPLGHHFYVDRDEILDWASFWTIRNTAVKALPPPVEKIFPLTANVKRLEAEKEKESQRDRGDYFRPSSRNMTAVEVFMNGDFAEKLSQLDGELAAKTATRMGNMDALPEEDEEDDGDDGEME